MSMEQLKVNYADGEILKADDINKINKTINNIITNSKVDQEYNASSTNAQSGKAVAEAIDNMKNDILGEGTTETFDTLKEIEDWIEKQGGSAVELTLAINNEAKAREDKDKELQDQIDTKFDEEQVNDAIETALAGYDPIDEEQLVGQKTENGGEIFNHYEDYKDDEDNVIEKNKALSPYSTATGHNNIAGAKAFIITDWGKEAQTYPLDSVEGLTNGDRFSLEWVESYSDCGAITAIDTTNNKITVDKFIIGSSTDESVEKLLFIHNKPWLGTNSYGYGAYVEGSENIALLTCSHTEGRDNKSLGFYSHTEGKSNVAAYGSHAEGKNNFAMGDMAHAEGRYTKALGHHSHAEGNGDGTNYVIAEGNASHAEGKNTHAQGDYTHTEGYLTYTSGINSHAEGDSTKAYGPSSHTEGQSTVTGQLDENGNHIPYTGTASHAEGTSTQAIGNNSHAEGYHTEAQGDYSHSEGFDTTAIGNNSHAEGNSNTSGIKGFRIISGKNSENDSNSQLLSLTMSNTTGLSKDDSVSFIAKGLLYRNYGTIQDISDSTIDIKAPYDGKLDSITFATEGEVSTNPDYNILFVEQKPTIGDIEIGVGTHSEGEGNIVIGQNAHGEGLNTFNSGTAAHTEGNNTLASGKHSHSEGWLTEATGNSSHAEGCQTDATGPFSHAEGNWTTASDNSSHAEGYMTEALGIHSHAEGESTKASGPNSHAEGNLCEAGNISHAEGYNTQAIPAEGKWVAHAEGVNTQATGTASHAQGAETSASGDHSHAGGYYTEAQYTSQTVIGEFNENKEDTLFEVGNGKSTDANDRKNAFEVYRNGSIGLMGENGIRIFTPAMIDKLYELLSN